MTDFLQGGEDYIEVTPPRINADFIVIFDDTGEIQRVLDWQENEIVTTGFFIDVGLHALYPKMKCFDEWLKEQVDDHIALMNDDGLGDLEYINMQRDMTGRI